MDERVLPKLSVWQSLTRNVRKYRQSLTAPEPQPNSLQDLQVPLRLQNTISGCQFMKFDSGAGNQRIILFTTDRNLDMLLDNNEWYMDGTFKTHLSLLLSYTPYMDSDFIQLYHFFMPYYLESQKKFTRECFEH